MAAVSPATMDGEPAGLGLGDVFVLVFRIRARASAKTSAGARMYTALLGRSFPRLRTDVVMMGAIL